MLLKRGKRGDTAATITTTTKRHPGPPPPDFVSTPIPQSAFLLRPTLGACGWYVSVGDYVLFCSLLGRLLLLFCCLLENPGDVCSFEI